MVELDEKDFKNILKSATPKELITVLTWDIFKPKKRNKLLENLKAGKSFKAAFSDSN